MNDQALGWYALLGDPVVHSKSPQIHSAFAEQTGLTVRYTKIRIPPGELPIRLPEMVAHGLKGANVTVPYKFEAFKLADQRTPRAEIAQAANTLIVTDKGIIADNTDGLGLVADIEKNAHFSLTGRRLLIIGAGGAVAGVLGAIMGRKPHSIVITNRTLEKAVDLVEHAVATDSSIRLEAKAFDETVPGIYDCIINGTSAELSGERLALPSRVFADCPLVVDMMYGRDLPFLREAVECGAMMTRDGLGMLVEQAAESFFLWHSIRPDTQPVLAEFRSRPKGDSPDGGQAHA